MESGGDNMLIGEFQHNLDSKGRVIVPSKFRELLGETLIVTVGLDDNLLIYTTQQFEQTAKQLLSLPNTNRKARQMKAVTLGKATQCDIDSQGRILIPSPLIEAGNLKKNCVFVGLYDHIELWDKQAWENYYSEAAENIDEVAEDLTEFL